MSDDLTDRREADALRVCKDERDELRAEVERLRDNQNKGIDR